MVETISPVVYGGRTKKYRGVVAIHALGAVGAASLVGVVLGAVGTTLEMGAFAAILIASVAALYLAREALNVPIPIPAGRRQVPEWWRTFFGPRTAALLYGAGLGAGFATPLTFGTLVVVATGALVSGSWLQGALLLAPFGLARGLSVALAPLDRLETVGAQATPRRANALVLAATLMAAFLS